MATAAPTDSPCFTAGDIARRYGLQLWQARTIFARRLVPARPKVGNYPVIWREDLPAVEAGLRELGYLTESRPISAA